MLIDKPHPISATRMKKGQFVFNIVVAALLDVDGCKIILYRQEDGH